MSAIATMSALPLSSIEHGMSIISCLSGGMTTAFPSAKVTEDNISNSMVAICLTLMFFLQRVLSVYALCCKDKNIYVNNCVSHINNPHLIASVAVFAVKKCYIFSCSDIFS